MRRHVRASVHRWAALAAVWATGLARAHGEVTFVQDGRARAIVVVADNATAIARYAAEELVSHVERASGAKLAIVREAELSSGAAAARVYIGDTRAARAAGIAAAQLAPERSVLRVTDRGVFIAGGDAEGDPLEPATFGGTLFGVYEWLERDLGVRWLWPGELGTVVPKTTSVFARDIDTTFAPAFFQRNIRGGLTFKGEHAELGFAPDVAADYAREQAVFLRRHRMGKSLKLSYGHAFTDWWANYGAAHPEWFHLVNAKRGPSRPGASYSMCVSNPEFRRQIIAQWQERRAGQTGPESHFVNGIENGIMGLCECDACRAWDGPQPAEFLKYYPPKSKVMGSRFVTDRYVRYWLDVQRQAAAINPEATVIVYNYFNYFHPPSPGTKLNRHILVGSYPSAGWFPRSAEAHAWFKQQWNEWEQTGARLFSRGNYCLDGYTMPLVFGPQFADEFQHQARHGMEATDYDALTGQWASQGTNLYLLARLHTRPQANVGELLNEYYRAFGSAADDVRRYFEYWENFVAQRRETIDRQFEDNTSRWRAFAIAAHVAFPPESFARAAAILVEAGRHAGADHDKTTVARVRFLQAGLEHARLCAEVSAALTLNDASSSPERGRDALARLIAFRREHAREWIANFNHCSWVEDKSWRLPSSLATLPTTSAPP